MDPNETLKDLLMAIGGDEREEAIEHLENLKDWLVKGGFMPDLDNAWENGPYRIYGKGW